MSKFKKFIPIIAGILFLLSAAISVAVAWISDVHKYDLGITFSGYVGSSRFTSTLHLILMVIMIAMMIYYVAKTRMPVKKRVIYAVVLLCIFGTAFFPYNYYSDAPVAITIDLHNDFAIALMLAATVSFVFTAVMTKSKKRRVAAVLSIAYAVAFIGSFSVRFPPLFQTIFIWENMFILLLLIEMHMEQFEETEGES